MLLIAATALAGSVNLGWPCARMNWAWRNVWSTCSINSYVPTGVNTADQIPAHFRRHPVDATLGPASWLQTGTNHIVPFGAETGAALGGAVTVLNGVPQMFCQAMMNTQGNTLPGYTLLRNRCRRAVDAYGGLVHQCSRAPALTLVGPIASSHTEFAPATAHIPHALNVAALSSHARRCIQGGDDNTFGTLIAPHTTCPGLQGWWSVVWNVCGFRARVPLNAAGGGAFPGGEHLAGPNIVNPLGVLSFAFLNRGVAAGGAAPVSDAPGEAVHAPNFVFCSPIQSGNEMPNSWNMRGPNFRTSRCRRALDQFGRTGARCGGTAVPAAGSPQVGFQDKLRVTLNGADAAAAPVSLARLSPLCN